jgi:hypothetical protein
VKGIVWALCPKIPLLYLHDEGKGDAVVGLALRFALKRSPYGLAGLRSGQGQRQKQEQRPKENKKNKKQKKGTF